MAKSTSWEDPLRVASVLTQLKYSEQPRSVNRARVVSLMNGNPPYTEQEARDNRIGTNVNFLEPVRILQDARRQYYNAFIRPGQFFTVRLDSGPPEKRIEWGHIITKHINRVMKDSLEYTLLLQQTFAQMALHGIGPVMWEKRKKWIPSFVGIDEILVPGNTRQDLRNLDYFFINRRYSLGELHKMTHGEAIDPGWNMKLVNEVTERMAKQLGSPGYIPQPQYWQWERFEEDMKSNSGYWSSDSSPTISCYDFFYRENYDESETGEAWCRKIILDSDSESSEGRPPEYIFNPRDRVYASDISHLLHVNFSDGANTSPFRYHSVRGLGFMLYAVCHLQNRLRCKFNDACWESMLWFFRDVSDGTAERLERIDLQHLGIIPQGVNFVPATERHSVDFNLVNGLFSMNRQLMSENSTAFTRDIDSGTQKEMTATETMARVEQASAMVGSMLNMAYIYQNHQYKELARRFCLKVDNDTNPDRDIAKFQSRCLEEGVPAEALNSDLWIVEAERVVGTGNKVLELAQTQRLIEKITLFDPEAQRLILHLFAEATVDDPALAETLVPMGQQMPSEAMEVASGMWATLMDGKPVVLSREINEIDYTETLLHLLNMEIDTIEKSQEVPEQRRIAGLANVIQHIGQHVAQIAQNEQEGQRTKAYGDQLKKAANYVRAYAQRAEEAAQANGNGQDPALQAKIKSMVVAAEAKAEISRQLASQKQSHKDLAFVNEQARKDAKTRADISTEDLKTASQILRDNASEAHSVQRDNVTALADVHRENAISAATLPEETNGQ